MKKKTCFKNQLHKEHKKFNRARSVTASPKRVKDKNIEEKKNIKTFEKIKFKEKNLVL